MINSLVDLLHSWQQSQNDMNHALQAIQLSLRGHANDSLIDDILNFNGKPEL